ncbi:MAG TPA: hypothetical protein VF721_17855 [Pyrinomonadaceae bacterium]|jgi:hypothetical protein
MNLKIALGLFIAFGVIVAPVNVYAQNKSILKLADEYALALRKYRAQKSRASVADVMRMGKAVAGDISQIEDLSDAEYALFKKKMQGFVVNREEILVIEPDLDFFARLSATRGTKVDAAFFALMRQIKPGSVFPAYIEMQTDVTGCTIYGNGAMTGLYGKALRFKKTYPNEYAGEVNEEINKIIEELTTETCACSSRASVEKEFRAFIKAFPKDKNTPAIKKRLANLKGNKEFRFYCQSG